MLAMDKSEEMKLKSFDFAEATSKQLITLSTAIVAFTITFGKELFGGVNNKAALVVLIISWALYALCIVFGVWTLMALTGSLAKPKKEVTEGTDSKDIEVSIYDKNITIPEILQIFSFVLALIMTIFYAIILVFAKPVTPVEPINSQEELKIVRESTYTLQDSIKVDTFYVAFPKK